MPKTVEWSPYVLFWATDISIGGKLFALMNHVSETNAIITYAATPMRYVELLELEGVSRSVEFPRLKWVQMERWDVFRQAGWQSGMEAAHAIITAKLPKRTRDVLAMQVRKRKQRQDFPKSLKCTYSKQLNPEELERRYTHNPNGLPPRMAFLPRGGGTASATTSQTD